MPSKYDESRSFYQEFFSCPRYDRPTSERYETVARLIDEHALPSSTRVLEIGCGGGEISSRFSESFSIVYALDIGLTAAMKNTLAMRRNIRFLLGALPCLPIPDSSFDLVVCSEVLEHLYREDQLPSIEAIARVTRPGGLSIVTTPNPLGIRSMMFLPIRGVRRALRRNPGGQLVENWIRPSEIRGMVHPWFYVEKALGTSYTPPMTERLPRSLQEYLYDISAYLGKREMLRALGEYQYYALRRRALGSPAKSN